MDDWQDLQADRDAKPRDGPKTEPGSPPTAAANRLMPLLSLFTDHDDVCFWEMSLNDGNLHFPENARIFFHGDDAQDLPATSSEWLHKLVVEEDRPKVDLLLAGLGTQSTYVPRFTYRILDAAGNIHWIEQRGAATGSPTNRQMVWLSQDVTEKLKTADTLDATKGTLQHILDHADVGMVMLNASGEFTYCNPAFCTMLHTTPDSLLGKPLSPLLGDLAGQGRSFKFTRLLGGEERSFHGECRLIGPSGHRIWVETNLWLLPDTPGIPQAFFGMITSIEERLHATARLRQERDTLRAVFDNADIGLALADASGHVTAMNAVALKTFGLQNMRELRERLGNLEQHYTLQSPDGQELPPAQWPIRRAARNEFVSDLDLILTRKKTGDSRYVKFTCIPVYDQSGEKHLVVCSINDLTEIRRLHEALSQSQRLEALGRLAGGVAHDFNNVLAVIAGNLELIADSMPDERTRARIAAAKDAAETGIHINQRLLTIARRRLPRHERVDVVKRVRAMVELIERTLGSGIALEIDIPVSRGFARIDPGDLDAAFLNLVSNARDSMPQGGGLRISLRLADGSREGTAGPDHTDREIILSVRDTGSGMSPQTLRMAAEPFFTTKPVGKGTGLGLTGVYVFAQDCGGHVEIDSKLGRGTEVKLCLPLVESTDQDGENPDEADLPLGSGELVLVVEDDKLVREVTCERLLRLGYRVEEVESGDAAIECIEGGLKPACVLSDIEMPGRHSGLLLAEKLEDLLPGCKTVLCTGYHDPKIMRRDRRERSKWPILNKPYSLGELATAIHEALRVEDKDRADD